ncbi:MAG: 50S ribosomal protein L29 [Succinatimonas hippei]|nr:50S ribosomal protein L29 [Succinatimonas hippei]
MQNNELRQKSVEELNKELSDLNREQFNLRFSLKAGQSTKTHEVRKVRRNIARVKTILNEKKSAQQSAK